MQAVAALIQHEHDALIGGGNPWLVGRATADDGIGGHNGGSLSALPLFNDVPRSE